MDYVLRENARLRSHLLGVQKVILYAIYLQDLKTTRINVAIGPSNKEMRNQLRPFLFLLWAIPAFISASVPHPTA